MKVRVEVGTAEQKALILEEFTILEHVAAAANVTHRIAEVVVPGDFDPAVRRLSGDQVFQANRGYHLVLAKTVPVEGGHCLLISPVLFTEGFDTQVRIRLYLHELMHVVHRTRFPSRAGESQATHYYLENLYCLYDDYAAERRSLEICAELFPEPSELYARFHRTTFYGFLKALNDESVYRTLSNAVVRFRLGFLDIEGFQTAVRPLFDQIAKSLAYGAAYIDSRTGFEQDLSTFVNARFVSDAAQRLVAYFASKYEADDYDLSDGVERMKNFTETFGFVFEDHPEGLYCRVVGLPF